MLAFLSILITTVNFVVSVEVNFYPKYRAYYSLFNDGGVVGDIVTAEEEMLAVLNRELYYTALKQLFATAAVISLENTLLELLPLGAKIITLELAVRFLTDYLDGDRYFRVAYPEHNLVRARAQMKLVADMEAHWDEMQAIVAEEAAKRN